MSNQIAISPPIVRTAEALSSRALHLLWAAALFALTAALIDNDLARLLLIVVSVTLVLLVALIRGLSQLSDHRRTHDDLVLLDFLAEDTAPSFLLGWDHSLLWANAAAHTAFPDLPKAGLSKALQSLMMTPSEVLRRLQSRLGSKDLVIEDIVVRRGHARAVLRKMSGNQLLFRLEHLVERHTDSRATTHVPLMTISAKGTILSMNEPMRQLLGNRMRHIDRVFDTPLGMQGAIMSLSPTDRDKEEVRVYHSPLQGDRREIACLPIQPNEISIGRGASAQADFDQLPVALVSLGEKGRVQNANRAAKHLLHIDEQEDFPLFSELLTGLGRSVQDWVEEALDAPSPPQAEVLRIQRGETESFTQVTFAQPHSGERGNLIAVLHDATELKTLEAQFVQGQKMQAIGQLAGGVAHDFNNLLTAISGHCDLLLLRHDQGDSDYADLIQINQNANRAASLVGQLLAFSRKQTLMPEVIDLRDTLADLTHLLNRLVGETILLSLFHDPDLPAIRADKRQLEQVVMNLVVNARDAMPEGGEICVETRRTLLTDPMQKGRATVPAGEYAVIMIRDQGVGIDADTLNKVFEPFFTTKRVGEGTGLGLSTAYGIIKQSGGFIFVDSIVGKGTEFSIFLPAFHGIGAEADARTALHGDASADGAAPTDGVILLVEDEAPVRAFAARALRLRGYTVLEAATGEEALSTLENEALQVDLFVSDVIMPGLDGPSWVKAARETRPETKAIFVSGYAEDLLSDDQSSMENAVFLPKPFSLQQLTDTVGAQFLQPSSR